MKFDDKDNKKAQMQKTRAPNAHPTASCFNNLQKVSDIQKHFLGVLWKNNL